MKFMRWNLVFGAHRLLITSSAITLGLWSLSTRTAYADYMTGFENPPFTLGGLAGQDGWSQFGPAAISVEDFLADTGSQAVFVDGGSTATSQSGAYHTDTAGSVVNLSADIYLASSSVETEWQFAALGASLNGYAGGIDIQAGTNEIDLISAGGDTDIGTFVRNQWNLVDLQLNYTTQTYSVSIDGTTLASNVAFCGSNVGCSGADVAAYANGLFDTFGGVAGSNDAGFMDNYAVSTATSTPEPSSAALIPAILLCGLFVFRRRVLRRS